MSYVMNGVSVSMDRQRTCRRFSAIEFNCYRLW
jgi:hypothetical protein